MFGIVYENDVIDLGRTAIENLFQPIMIGIKGDDNSEN